MCCYMTVIGNDALTLSQIVYRGRRVILLHAYLLGTRAVVIIPFTTCGRNSNFESLLAEEREWNKLAG